MNNWQPSKKRSGTAMKPVKTSNMKNKEKSLALLGAAVFLAVATAIGAFIRKL